ncbi:MAG TPA: hypothetical protein DCS97_11105 [Planctomycetes bacterium]|nr:hypothetical protein [Planctomycetota bacterium]
MVGLLILAIISITLVIALRTAEEGRIWLLLGACVAGAGALHILVVVMSRMVGGGSAVATRGWRTRGPWPEGPGLAEHRSPTSHLLGATLGLGTLGLGLGSQAVLVISRGTWDGVLILAFFASLTLAGAFLAGYQLAQALRYRPAFLRPSGRDWPLAPGDEVQLDLAGPLLALTGSEGLDARLILLQERMVTHVNRRRSMRSVQVDRLAEVPIRLSLRLPPDQGLDARLTFRLPTESVLAPAARLTGPQATGARVANRRADGSYAVAVPEEPPHPVPVDTDLSADEPRYWLLVMRATVAGIDWYAEWLLPVEYPVMARHA